MIINRKSINSLSLIIIIHLYKCENKNIWNTIENPYIQKLFVQNNVINEYSISLLL